MPVGTPATIRTLEGDMDMVVEEDLYIMIGIRGDIYLKTREEFQKSYAFVDDNCTYKDCIGREEYEPVMKNRISGEDICLTDYASGVPVGGDLEYIDEVTLLRALEGRTEL